MGWEEQERQESILTRSQPGVVWKGCYEGSEEPDNAFNGQWPIMAQLMAIRGISQQDSELFCRNIHQLQCCKLSPNAARRQEMGSLKSKFSGGGGHALNSVASEGAPLALRARVHSSVCTIKKNLAGDLAINIKELRTGALLASSWQRRWPGRWQRSRRDHTSWPRSKCKWYFHHGPMRICQGSWSLANAEHAECRTGHLVDSLRGVSRMSKRGSWFV